MQTRIDQTSDRIRDQQPGSGATGIPAQPQPGHHATAGARR